MQRFLLTLTADGWQLIIIDMNYGPTSELLATVAPELNNALHAEARRVAQSYGATPPRYWDWRREGPGEYTA